MVEGMRAPRALFVVVICFFAPLASAQGRSWLHQDEFLGVNQSIVSPNGRAMAIQQSDGNFCVYAGAPAVAAPGHGAWCHMQHRGNGAWFTIIQSDGNLCTYKGTGPSDNKGLEWCSMKYGPQGPYFVVLGNDGNLCTHKGTDPQSGDWGVLWCSMDGTVAPPTPGVVDVSQVLAGTFNSDPNNAWLRLATAVGAQNADLWYIESMKVTKLDNTAFTPGSLQANTYYVGSQQVVNCGASSLTETVSVTSDVTNSLSLSKSTTFDASVSATVSYSGLVVSGSVTATASTSSTSGSESSTSNTQTFSKSSTITLNERSGTVMAMQGVRNTGNNVPWTASFVPTDSQTVAIVARRVGANDRVNGTLPWIQVKSYLPEAKRTLTLNGTLTVDSTDVSTGGLVAFAMTPDMVTAQCNAPAPILAPTTQVNVAAAGMQNNVARQPAPSANKNVRKVNLSAAETAALVRNLQPGGH